MLIVLCVITLILHVMPRPSIQTPYGVFFNSYLIDVLLPAYLFMLSTMQVYRMSRRIQENPLRFKLMLAGMVFLIGITIEILQYFHVPVLGRTFDPLDFLMYLFGVMIGLGIDFCVVRGSEMIKNRVS